MKVFERCPICNKIVMFSINSDYYKFKTKYGFWAERLIHKKCYIKLINKENKK